MFSKTKTRCDYGNVFSIAVHKYAEGSLKLLFNTSDSLAP